MLFSLRGISSAAPSQKSEGDTPAVYKFMAIAYCHLGQVPQAELATAEAAWLMGDRDLTVQKAKAAQVGMKRGTPEWVRANDLLTFAGRK